MRRLVGAVLVVAAAACSGGDGVNLYAEARLGEATNVEIELLAGGDGVGRWVTVNDAGLVAEMAKALDRPLPTTDAAACAPTYQVRFFLGDGSVVAFGYDCAGGPALLTGPEIPDAEGVAASDDFAVLVDAEAALLEERDGP